MASKKPEKVELFVRGSWENRSIEDDYNEWMKKNGDKIEIIDRQFRLAAATGREVCPVEAIAVFYRDK